MARLLVHLEGQTEEDFVNEMLSEHLLTRGYERVSARIMGNARLRCRRGGIRPWPSAKKDIVTHLKEDPKCIATTMVDYYGLPHEGQDAWPGRKEAASRQTQMAEVVERALLADLKAEMGDRFDDRRFLPFVVMHEFEGLLFSDCHAFSRGIGRPNLERNLKEVRDQFDTPEDINDSPLTAPSKRVRELLPEYEKPLFGCLAALEIGLDCIRRECPHFNSWLQQLESRV
jgi:Domain of unknown function (DUF4276)